MLLNMQPFCDVQCAISFSIMPDGDGPVYVLLHILLGVNPFPSDVYQIGSQGGIVKALRKVIRIAAAFVNLRIESKSCRIYQ